LEEHELGHKNAEDDCDPELYLELRDAGTLNDSTTRIGRVSIPTSKLRNKVKFGKKNNTW
jgi:hypothetical protein